MEEKTILDKKNVQRILSRMAHEILEHNKGVDALVLIGISMGGNILCKRLHDSIKSIEGVSLPMGVIDVTLYRDDIRTGSTQQTVHKTNINFSLEGKNVILIDDVLYTGRTIRAALDALMDFGRPNTIQLAVFIDRGHRELPIRADYVGKNIPTSSDEKVVLQMTEDGEDCVVVEKGKGN
jgi:pyrimidine operon attenuation protein/uracil phosphoribosyltransferase